MQPAPPPNAPRILVADDDSHLRDVVAFALRQAGFAVDLAADGRTALEAFRRAPPALVVLDVTMPELDGLEVCRTIRQTSAVPIVFLSSKDEEIDRVVGLELGGDDYLGKPFSPRELIARVKAVLRRHAPPSAPTQLREGREGRASQEGRDRRDGAAAPTLLVRGPLRLDVERWRAFWNDAEVSLTVTEFNVVLALLRAPEKAFTREDLMARVYEDAVVSDRTIDSHVRRIRQKFAAAGGDVIETVHGLGYRLAAIRP